MDRDWKFDCRLPINLNQAITNKNHELSFYKIRTFDQKERI